VVSSYFTLMESEQSHDHHSAPTSVLVHSNTLCGNKYRYAHTKISLTSPTHCTMKLKPHSYRILLFVIIQIQLVEALYSYSDYIAKVGNSKLGLVC